MHKSQWQQIEKIFSQAIVLAPGNRLDYVRQECSGEEDLYREVISLLSADSQSDQIFAKSVMPLIGELLNQDVATLIEQSNFASYKLQKVLGQGGAGTVILAEDLRLKRQVAVKILPRLSGHPATVQRFRKEALAASSVVHPNVAHIYEFDNHDGIYYLAMEYVAGRSLREVLSSEKLELSDALEIVIQVARALRAAHKKYIYHRDIKPENIMLTGDGLIKILDFGLAKFGAQNAVEIGELESVPGLILGTTAYMSPEQIRADPIDGKADLWSLGVMFYELLTGTRPFQGKTVSDVQAAVLLSDPPPVSITDKPPCISIIIDKLLVKDSAKRYQTADELLEDLSSAQRKVYDYRHKRSLPHKVSRFFRNILHL